MERCYSNEKKMNVSCSYPTQISSKNLLHRFPVEILTFFFQFHTFTKKKNLYLSNVYYYIVQYVNIEKVAYTVHLSNSNSPQIF